MSTPAPQTPTHALAADTPRSLLLAGAAPRVAAAALMVALLWAAVAWALVK